MSKIMRNGVPYGTGGGGGSSWIESVPEMHRNIFRGNNLGSEVTAAQLSAIQNGTFSNLYVGDYWVTPITINGTEKSVNWRIADIDYYYVPSRYQGSKYYDEGLSEHHLLMLPDEGLYETTYKSYNDSTDYLSSTLRSSRTEALTAVNSAFPNMLLTYNEYLTDNCNSYSISVVTHCDLEALNVAMVYGNYLRYNAVDTSNSPVNSLTKEMSIRQLALFKLAPTFIISDHPYWLRNLTASFVGAAQAIINATTQPIATGIYNRPYFLIGVSNEE